MYGLITAKINADECGDWQPHTACSCETKFLKVTLMIKKHVPFTDRLSASIMNGARAILLGIAELWLHGQSPAHECIQFSLKCSQCGWKGCLTMDYSNNEQKDKKRFGKYCKTLDNSFWTVSKCKLKNLTLYELENVYYEHFNWKAKDYNLSDNNCKYYANFIWNTIVKKYEHIIADST